MALRWRNAGEIDAGAQSARIDPARAIEEMD
jgi:hypothetical protein